MICLLLAAAALLAQGGIETLEPPRPATPPHVDAEGSGRDDLEAKRDERARRDAEAAPKPLSAAQKRRRDLAADAAAPHPGRFFAEVSVLGGGAATSGDKSAYTLGPTSHFNFLMRSSPDARRWYGLRIAPFAGTGYYKGKPGTFGLTYFGPMIGLGKIDPAAAGDGRDKAAAGWLVTSGIAGLSKTGRTETAERDTRHSDFTAHKGVIIDGVGWWAEARYLRVFYGALGIDGVLGVQTGRQRQFIYAGVGASGLY